MPFIHYYRCSCVNWLAGYWVKESSNDKAPKYDKTSHITLDSNTRCRTYSRYDHTEEVIGYIPPAKGSAEEGKQLVMKYGPTTNATTVAVMWDSETQRWYYGKSRHGRGPRNVPAAIWTYIKRLEKQNDQWFFRENCGGS
jgi:hypothetical protein